MSHPSRVGLGKWLAAWAAATMLSTATQASDWWHVAEHGLAPGRVEEFVDRDSVRRNTVFNRLVMTMTVTEQPFGNRLSALQGFYDVDCRKPRSRAVLRIGLLPDGRAAATPDRAALPWRRNAADSFAAVPQAIACAGEYPDGAFGIDGLDPQVVTKAYFDAGRGE